MTTITNRVPPGVTEIATRRVVGAITQNITRRVPEEIIGRGPFLMLEGDFAGALAVEGDEDGYLRLQGV